MVFGLVYRDVDVEGSPIHQLETVKQHLTQAIPNVALVQLGSPMRQEIAYADEGGRSLLKWLQFLEREVKRIDNANKVIKEENKVIKEENKVIKEDHSILMGRNGSLSDWCQNLNEKHETLKGQHEVLRDEHEILRDNHEILRDNHEILRDNHEILRDEHEILRDEHEILQDSHKMLHDDHETLGGQHRVLGDKHETLQDSHKMLHDDHENLKDEYKTLNRQHETLEDKHKDLMKELTILRPLQSFAVGIRKRFFAKYEQYMGRNGPENDETIRAGNCIGHGGDVITDICLLRNGLMDYVRSFKALYGLQWFVAEKLTVFPHMVTVMNRRATVVADERQKWTMGKQFGQLVEWTQNATSEELDEFAADLEGKSYPRLLFSQLTNCGQLKNRGKN